MSRYYIRYWRYYEYEDEYNINIFVVSATTKQEAINRFISVTEIEERDIIGIN